MSSVEETMAAHAAEAMKLTRKHFVVELDYSEASMKQLDQLIEDVEYAYPGGKSPENVELLARVWGAYVGETIRRNLGGQWVRSNTGAVLQVNGRQVVPHDAIRDCLTKKSETNISQLYEQTRDELSS